MNSILEAVVPAACEVDQHIKELTDSMERRLIIAAEKIMIPDYNEKKTSEQRNFCFLVT